MPDKDKTRKEIKAAATPFPKHAAALAALRRLAAERDLDTEVAPGLAALTILFSTTSMTAIVITFEKRIDALERLLLAPLGMKTLILGKAAGSSAIGVSMGVFVLLVSLPVFGLSVSSPVLLILCILLSAFAFAFMGLLISVGVREVFEAMTLSNFFRFPMMFLCGVFFPFESLPKSLQIVGYFLPLTYSVDLLRYCLLEGRSFLNPYLDLAALAVFNLLLFLLIESIFRKRLREQY
ncbi:MAG: ABC transporter permease [Desulfobacteraceae bacterium]|nr:MAG: ABC transporter permease [Desulfobacteraceae bacterium]